VVVVFIIAIAVSSDIYDKVGGFGDTGGIIGKNILSLGFYTISNVVYVGASVSGAFLFIIGVVNSYILFQNIKERRRSAVSIPYHGLTYDKSDQGMYPVTLPLSMQTQKMQIVDRTDI
jgi:high-affinity nickel permease